MDRETAPAAASPARPEGYAKGRVTKQAIVERAADAFAEKGFYGASLRSIAREAGIDHSTLIHHFGNKTALLLAVIEWHDTRGLPEGMQGVGEALEMMRSLPVQTIADSLAANARRNLDSPGLVQLLSLLTAEAGSANHPARAVLQERHDTLRDILAHTIERGRAANGGTDDPLTPEQRAVAVIAAQEGLETYNALHPGEIDMPTLFAQVLASAFELPAPDESR
ncbi:TetR/AcrR family transcriptional regulator [Demequina zhanjiangensis]|uniref:TetR/AcrR family transcriptional regulator n=1 Tax=Demequina zhanjiangensis TaxID=3051659 RepID=A0ABT8G1F4_9MICO|nr:TetR/AcrR family transcriptional regulator [Demequina sp. SYSU T00b26]MDN4472902.1 TetR/AcrR family transcriptional regulator [Demequina sp. SYSU T00b26]